MRTAQRHSWAVTPADGDPMGPDELSPGDFEHLARIAHRYYVDGRTQEEIGREFLALDYSVLDADKPGMLALYPNDWERVKVILQ